MDFTKFLKDPIKNIPTIEEAIKISKKYKIDLHPQYLFYWNELTTPQLIKFLQFIKNNIKTNQKSQKFQTHFPLTKEKRYFELLGIEHKIQQKKETKEIILNKLNSQMLLLNLGIDISDFDNIELNICKNQLNKTIKYTKENPTKTSVQILNANSQIGIRDKGGTYIGARMGRPEKAKMRKQFNEETRSHGLFPIGTGENYYQNRSKDIIKALEKGEIEENFRMFYCKKCQRKTIYPKCEICQSKTQQLYFEKYTQKQLKKTEKKSKTKSSILYQKTKINTDSIQKQLQNILTTDFKYPKTVKGITSTINEHHTTEHISKAFLRAKHNVFVNKDGTVRYDMIEMGITHFKPKEIETSVQKLKQLGYTHDYLNNPLENENQIIEIMPQDVILPDCIQSGDELASDYIINTGNFVDELLEKLYKQKPFYSFKTKEDTIGHLIVGIAPHTSAGIIGRIIGYSKTQGCFSHPVWHAAQRRNLDGDENGIFLLLDGLINFSREYLPNRRGAKTMDVPLVLTSHLHLDQIDDEVHGMDIAQRYPLEFYKAAKQYKNPKTIKIEQIKDRINKKDLNNKYLGYSFTHNTNNFNNTVLCSSYKTIPSMSEKLDKQLKLAKKIRAVNENKVASLVIEKHFLKDIKGNLQKFSAQTFRCTKCNTKYRRPPLSGICKKCKSTSINFTIHEGSIKKYIQPSLDIIENYKIDSDIAETIELVKMRFEGLFGGKEE